MSQIIILGAGFGGLSSANELHRLLGDKHKIILIDRKKKFSVGASNLWVMLGKRSRESCEKEISLIENKGIKFVNEDIVDINTDEKRVYTTTNYFKYDYLIIALGTELYPEAVMGFKESALNLYEMAGAHDISQEIEKFYRGRIVILISRMPFKCPAAPYEAGFLLDEYFRNNGRRENVSITICTPEPQPLPTAGKAGSELMMELLKAKNILLRHREKALSIDSQRKIIVFESGVEERFDLLIGVPAHIPPIVAKKFVNESNWIQVDKSTLKTSVKDVYAIGDVTILKLSNSMAIPKAGIFADEEGSVVAFNIASEILGKQETKSFEGRGYCFLETGNMESAKIEGSFFTEPEPRIVIKNVSKENYYEKIKFEKDTIERFFG